MGSSVHLQVAAQPFGRQGKWAEEEHLRGAKCAGKRERFNVVMGPFLAELLSKGAVKSEARLLPRTWQMERFPRINFPSILVPAFKTGSRSQGRQVPGEEERPKFKAKAPPPVAAPRPKPPPDLSAKPPPRPKAKPPPAPLRLWDRSFGVPFFSKVA